MAKKLSEYIHPKNTIILVIVVATLLIFYFYFSEIMSVVASIITHYDSFVLITVVICSGIGATHAITKRTREDNVFFSKFIGNPFIAAVFTAVTYGIVISGCLTLFYMLLYDPTLKEKYPNIERYATSVATILLFIGSIYGIGKMVGEICKPAETKAIVENPNQQNTGFPER